MQLKIFYETLESCGIIETNNIHYDKISKTLFTYFQGTTIVVCEYVDQETSKALLTLIEMIGKNRMNLNINDVLSIHNNEVTMHVSNSQDLKCVVDFMNEYKINV